MSCGVTQGSVTVSYGVTQGSVTVSCGVTQGSVIALFSAFEDSQRSCRM